MIKTLEEYIVSDQCVLKLNQDEDSDLYTVGLDYMNGAIVATMMGSEDKSTAEHFYKQVKDAYETLIY